MNARLSDTTRKNYEDSLVRQFRFFFEHQEEYPGILKEWMAHRLDCAAIEDSLLMTCAGRPTRLCPYFKTAVIDALHMIVTDDESTHPLNFLHSTSRHSLNTSRHSRKA
jgi:hypothetical protein